MQRGYKLIKAEPHVIGTLKDGTEIIEIICPLCGSEWNEPIDDHWKCCRCGIEFIQDYKVV